MRSAWPVQGRVLVGAAVGYAACAAAVSFGYTRWTGLSRWTMLPAGPQHSYANLLTVNLAAWLTWALLALAVFRLGRRLPIGRSRWVRPLLLHALLSVAVASLHGVVVASVRVWLQAQWGLQPQWGASVAEHLFRNIDLHVPIYWALVGLQHAVDYHREVRARDVAAAQVETRLVEAQLQALHRQVHPHFLFNTLHAISALLHRDPDTADRMIERLSDMLRVTLAAAGVQQVPLRQEMDFLQAYLDIEQVHFGPRLQVDLAIDPDTLEALVPSLILQPLAENAVRHGLAPLPAGGTLHVSAHVDDDMLELVVRDDGRGPAGRDANRHDAVPGHGVGLANTRARLEALHRGRASLDVRGRAGGGTEVTLRLPLRLASGATRQVRRAS